MLRELEQLNADLEQLLEARTSELSAARKDREVLLQEVHHRVKNNLPASSQRADTHSLGMQLVATLAEQLDGELRIHRDNGTCFELRFRAL